MIIFDTETTALKLPTDADLKAQPSIIEIGAIKLDAKYEEVARYTTLVDPGVPLNEVEHATITKLTNADLQTAPPFLAVYPDLADFFLGERRLIAHNAPFDMAVLTFDLTRINAQFAFPYPVEQFCSAQYTETKFGRRLRLVDWYEKVMGKKYDQTHRAIDDAAALAEVVRKLKL